jgi:hypothetical protein
LEPVLGSGLSDLDLGSDLAMDSELSELASDQGLDLAMDPDSDLEMVAEKLADLETVVEEESAVPE